MTSKIKVRGTNVYVDNLSKNQSDIQENIRSKANEQQSKGKSSETTRLVLSVYFIT